MRSLSLRRTLLAGGAAVLLVGSALGLALAQEAPESETQPRPAYQAFIDALAARLGISSENLQQAMAEARAEVGLPERGMKHGFGFGPRGHHRGIVGVGLSVAAEAIGIPVDQLRQDLPGSSLAQVVEAHGADPAEVAARLESAANERIDHSVAAGRLSEERAEQLKQHTAKHLERLMNRVVPERFRGFRGARPTPSFDGLRMSGYQAL